MPLNFPSSPTNGQTFTDGDKVYVWDATAGVWNKTFSGASDYVANALVDAKGDLVTATADNTPARLGVGANDTVLTADSSTATGLAWKAPASSGLNPFLLMGA